MVKTEEIASGLGGAKSVPFRVDAVAESWNLEETLSLNVALRQFAVEDASW